MLRLGVLTLSWFCGLGFAAVFNVRDYGAKGDGVSLDTDSIRKAIGAASLGGTILFPAGKYLTAPFNLTSHVTLSLDADSYILGVQNADLYPIIPPLPTYGVARDKGLPLRYQALIMASNVENVTITGRGTIDGQGDYWWNLFRQNQLKAGRPRLVEWYNCSNIVMDSVTVRNPGFWTLHPIYCKNVWLHHLNISNDPTSPNTDGIDPDSSENVLIEHNFVSVGDDHIAIKSGLDAAGLKYNISVRNVTVRNNHFGAGHGISIGSETSGGVYDIYVYNNVIVGPALHGLQIKTAPARGNVISNINFESCTVGDVRGPAVAILMNYDKSPPAPVLPIVRNVVFNNISAANVKIAGEWDCLANSPCQDIEINLVTVQTYNQSWICNNVRNSKASSTSPSGLQECFNKS